MFLQWFPLLCVSFTFNIKQYICHIRLILYAPCASPPLHRPRLLLIPPVPCSYPSLLSPAYTPSPLLIPSPRLLLIPPLVSCSCPSSPAHNPPPLSLHLSAFIVQRLRWGSRHHAPTADKTHTAMGGGRYNALTNSYWGALQWAD